MTTARPFLFLSVRPEHDAVQPEYAAMLSATGLGPARLLHHRLDLEPLPPLPLTRFAGAIVGGSPYNVSQDAARKSPTQLRVEADLARLAVWGIAEDFPLLFTCYGIGVLTQRLGGSVDTRFGEEAGPVTVSLTDAGRADPLLGSLHPEFTALVGHKESTSELPEAAVLLATSDECPVQVYRVGSNVYATQFHPEVLPEDFIARAYVYQHHGYFPADELAQVAMRLAASVVTEPRRLMARFVEHYGG
ncbi:glutamine amidotransferase [Luethyella okanaganae]|uniref:Glutamine amidotransferase n=1 Tax=Luethyella okanaganae TaxID=69372 RepID=A0ABW1VFB0_9MICO